MAVRESLIASRYDGLPMGPAKAYSFETQPGIPVDGGSQLLRDLSPFTIRIIPPSLVEAALGVDVNLIGRADQSTADFDRTANAVRSLFGISSVSGAESGQALGTLQQLVSAGQVVSSATTTVERTVIVDQYTAADIALQVERILQTPPLTLLVNPDNMSIQYSVVQQYSNRNRYGFIFERWGEGQPTISFSGSTGAFIAGANPVGTNPTLTETDSVSGLQFASKRDSAAFQNLVSLLQFYKNSGMIFDTINQTEAHHMVGALAIDYDQWTYVGHIDSFDYSYDANEPHRIMWSMNFTVDQMYDNAQAPVAVQPHKAPAPNPAYPSRPAVDYPQNPDGVTGGQGSTPVTAGTFVEGTEQFAQTPLNLLIPGA